MFPINRRVALLTPVFSAGAAVGSAWLLKHFPGLPVPSASELLAVELSAATSAAAAALKWLHGHQQYERLKAQVAAEARQAVATIDKLDPKLLGQLEGLAEAKAEEVIKGALVNLRLAPAAQVTVSGS